MRMVGQTLTLVTSLIAGGSGALADIYIPEGDANTTLVLSDKFEVLRRIEGLEAVHGLAAIPGRDILLAGSLATIERGNVQKPAAASEDEHDAHHGGGQEPMDGTVSIVSAVEAETGEIIKKIEVPGSVHHVETSTDGKWAVVTHPGLASVSIIDLGDFSVAATVATGPEPEYSVYDPVTGRFFVSNAGNGTVSDVDPEKGYVVRNLVLDNGPKHLAFDSEARRIFAAEADNGTVSVIDADSGDTLQRFEIGGELHGIAEGENVVYVSARETGKIVKVDVATGKSSEVSVGPQPYHMTLSDEGLLVSSAAEALVWVLDPRDLSVRSTIPTQGIGHQMVVSN
ncbi:YncE family protein [Oricola cellulosilytica]|uniref:YncE family protein n=2 Tax=Oricola cellulosilytica TaxID=1429082 RepID=A0A4R0PBJ6_9HYPH|nr:YncE family protein [Oricola cellulosilytica]TCD13727.1 YncE family protein [Oricola cellulosilytica]